jgi:hypothetical protein
LKYTMWASFAVLVYHLALIKKFKKVEQDTSFYLLPFLDLAKFIDWTVYDIKLLFTQPGMTKMLPDKLDIPGQEYPKTLVMNLTGTIVH